MITDTLKHLRKLRNIEDRLKSGDTVELKRSDLSLVKEASDKFSAVLRTWLLSAKNGRGKSLMRDDALPASIVVRNRRAAKRAALIKKIEEHL